MPASVNYMFTVEQKVRAHVKTVDRLERSKMELEGTTFVGHRDFHNWARLVVMAKMVWGSKDSQFTKEVL